MTNTRPADNQSNDDLLIANLIDQIDRLRYTYKCQEKAASRYQKYESWRKRGLILLTVLTTGTFVTALFALFSSELIGSVLVGGIATLATLTSFIGDFLDFPSKQAEHHAAGVKIRSIFVKLETTLSDYLAGALTAAETRKIRDSLHALTEESLLVAPRTTKSDYKNAFKSITTDEQTSSSQSKVLGQYFPTSLTIEKNEVK